ncbi:MAG: hypothetical protein V4509_00920 [Patescibacteria group bacterium]
MNTTPTIRINSPNTVLANSLTDAVDLIRPRIEINKPKEVVFCVGTQINGIPHIGTYIVQCASFMLAKKIREKFGVKTRVEFGALDNAPYDVVQSTGEVSYQRTYYHVLPPNELNALIGDHYTPYFDKLHEATGVGYNWSTYTETQASPSFRKHFLKTLNFTEQIRWCVGPSSGKMRIRIPCPKCYYAEKYADRTELINFDEASATFRCMCLSHGQYESVITADGNDAEYLDLNTLYRNLVKESSAAEDSDKLYVMVKGGDWAFSTQPVDWALGVMGYTSTQVPMRIFSPQIVTETGAKLSKSLVRVGDVSLDEVPEWLIDMGKFRQQNPDDYVGCMIWLVEQFLSHPRHMFRAYSYQEIIQILKQKTNTH